MNRVFLAVLGSLSGRGGSDSALLDDPDTILALFVVVVALWHEILKCVYTLTTKHLLALGIEKGVTLTSLILLTEHKTTNKNFITN